MNQQKLDAIKSYLQREDVQERLRESLHQARENVTVTISEAARLFHFTENQLRDWEEFTLLKPLRSTGRRLYPIGELEKLALIRELTNAKFAPSDIPSDIDKVWQTINSASEQLPMLEPGPQGSSAALSIDQRLELVRGNLFWCYFVTSALRLALVMICEDMPNTSVGLVLPLAARGDALPVTRVEDLARLGESLIGWLDQGHCTHVMLTSAPFFEHPSDYRLHPLTAMKDDRPEEAPQDSTLIFIDRRSRHLTLSAARAEAIRRLLEPVYEDVQQSRSCFGPGMRDMLIPAADLHGNANYDDILTGLVEMIVRLGGLTTRGELRWNFCCLLLPQDSMVPLHQRSMVVRAQSLQAPYKPGVTIITPDSHASNIIIKALQSGRIVYSHQLARSEVGTALRDFERALRSAIALPIEGENGLAVAVLYVASTELAAFSDSDQRLLRMFCRIIAELLASYTVRQQATRKLTDLIERPELVDAFFGDFLAEADFIHDVEALLSEIQTAIPNEVITDEAPIDELVEIRARQMAGRCVSFIGVDLDKQNSLANKYGDRAARNLAREVGLRIQEQVRVTFREYPHCRLYHIFADRFYIMLRDVTLERARYIAELLRLALAGTYKLDVLRASIDQPQRPESLLELSDITARLGVTSYSYRKLKEILLQHPPVGAESEVRAIISSALAVSLDIGRNGGGNVVFSWDEKVHDFVLISHATVSG
jgi:GAF domain-containing protein